MRLLAMMAALMGVLVTSVMPVTAQADDMYWTINNQTSFKLNYKFYVAGQNLEWPGDGNVYYSYPGQSMQSGLSCQAGTQVCFGGWEEGNVGRVWGMGASGNNSCEKCCYTCENGFMPTTEIVD